MKSHRSEAFQSPVMRLAFSQALFKARAATPGAQPKFGCTLISLPDADKAYKTDFDQSVYDVILATWGESGLKRAQQGLIKLPFLAGDGKEARRKETGELYEGFGPGLWFIRPVSGEDRPPAVRYRDAHTPATAVEVYSGCYVRAVLNAFSWHHPQSGDGVSFGVALVQKIRDGEPLGGAGPIDTEKWFDKSVNAEVIDMAEVKRGRGAAGFFS